MGKLTYITGGAKSGKTRLAQDQVLAGNFQSVAYLATQANDFKDHEIQRAIANHQASRPQSWQTVEAYQDLDQVIYQLDGTVQAVILDCVTLWLTNNLFHYWNQQAPEGEMDYETLSAQAIDQGESFLLAEMDKLLTAIDQSSLEVWMISNEVGASLVPSYALGRIFRNYQGVINQQIAQACHQAYWMVSGLSVRIK